MDVDLMEPNVGYVNPNVVVISGRVDACVPMPRPGAACGPDDRSNSVAALHAFLAAHPPVPVPAPMPGPAPSPIPSVPPLAGRGRRTIELD